LSSIDVKASKDNYCVACTFGRVKGVGTRLGMMHVSKQLPFLCVKKVNPVTSQKHVAFLHCLYMEVEVYDCQWFTKGFLKK
jgi:hypothetical protein